MLRLAVKKLGGIKDKYVISGQLKVFRGSELVAIGEISVRISTKEAIFPKSIPSTK